MTAKYISFTDKGERLADDIAAKIGGEVARCGRDASLDEWTANAFMQSDALIFVGAAGIAARAIAPYCRSKATDPAVVVVDECGRFVIPILSGHLGGANDLARLIASACGALPVITTATDSNGVFAVDEWAKRQNCAVIEPEHIKLVSSALLAGKNVKCYSAVPIAGTPPRGVEMTANEADADFCVGLFDSGAASLHIVPRACVLGVGCKRGTSAERLEEAFAAFAEANRLFELSVCAAASIDLKKDEAGLLELCQCHGWPLSFYSAEELSRAEGNFTPSAFVRSVTGVDNVCERAAKLASAGGDLIIKKYASRGVTFALALKDIRLDWRWQL